MERDEMRLVTADGMVPMEGRGEGVLRRGGVVIGGGRILEVGAVVELRERFGDLAEEYVCGVMLPGLVNVHTHLELGYQPRAERPGYFTDWVEGLMRNYPAAGEVEAVVTRAVIEGVAQSLRAGVTCVGDISRHCTLTRKVLSAGPLRVVSFGEVIGLGKMRGRQSDYLEAAADRSEESEFLTAGLSPHAPYTTEGPTLQKVVERAVEGRFPLTMHLAEMREEREFLRSGEGRLAEWPVMRNILDEEVPRSAEGPLGWAEEWGLLGKAGAARRVPVVLAHVNYCVDPELEILARSGASVAYCPRTRAYFGHDEEKANAPHRYRGMMAAGVNVCLGTDSLASNADLSVLQEAAFLWRRDALPAYDAIDMVTRRGAMALGLEAGVLAAGKLADVVIFSGTVKTTVEETLADLLRQSAKASAVWVGGRRQV